MPVRGGKRPGAGRKKGAVTKRVQEIVASATMSGETPLEYMLRVMRTSEDTKRKDSMAIAAAPFVHPKLAAVEHSGNQDKPIVYSDEADAFTRRIAARAPGVGAGNGTGESQH